MAEIQNVEVTEEQVKDAQDMWAKFTVATKYCCIATAIVLIGLALGFVKLF
tara:strand:- start:116 stop:268 length:153 start_codon:yes stop_codon:yes gene_type:complete